MQNRKRSDWTTLQTLIWLAFVFCAFCLYGSAFVAVPSPVTAILCTIAGGAFITLLHEAGHAIVAILCGWRVLVFAVRPFGLHIPTRTFVSLPRDYEIRGYGFIAFVPNELRNGTRRRRMTIIASGPGACLIFATAAFALYPWTRAFDTPELASSHFVLAIMVQALSSATVSLFPLGNSDGAQLWRAARAGAGAPRDRIGIWMSAMLKYRVRLRDLPGWMLAEIRASQLDDDSSKYMEGIEIGILLDSDPPDYAAARSLIDQYRARHGGGAWLDSCDAFVLAVAERNPEAAEARLWIGETESALKPMKYAAEAAVAASRSDVETAMNRLAEMRKAVRAVTPFPDKTFLDIQDRIELLF